MTYTASNGVEISNVRAYFQWAGRNDSGNLGYGADSRVDQAMAEWYRHREDERLGRVRLLNCPDNPIYPVNGGEIVRVLDEVAGVVTQWERRDFDGSWVPSGESARAAEAYFNSLEPTPKPGEVWQQHGEYLLVDEKGQLRDSHGNVVVNRKEAERVDLP